MGPGRHREAMLRIDAGMTSVGRRYTAPAVLLPLTLTLSPLGGERGFQRRFEALPGVGGAGDAEAQPGRLVVEGADEDAVAAEGLGDAVGARM